MSTHRHVSNSYLSKDGPVVALVHRFDCETEARSLLSKAGFETPTREVIDSFARILEAMATECAAHAIADQGDAINAAKSTLLGNGFSKHPKEG